MSKRSITSNATSSLVLVTGLKGSVAGISLPFCFPYTLRYWIPVVATQDTIVKFIIRSADDTEEVVREVPVLAGSTVLEGIFSIGCKKECFDLLITAIDPGNPAFSISSTPYDNLTIIPY